MVDPRRESGSGRGPRTTSGSEQGSGREEQETGSSRQASEQGGRTGTERGRESKTAGTNRDFDESEESLNQGHGHPREDGGV